MNRIGILAGGLVIGVALGVVAERRQHPPVAAPAPAAVPAPASTPLPNYAAEPAWAYGWATPPKTGDTAAPVAPPSRALRPNEDPAEQTKPRHVAGSTATYSLVDVRDGGHVIDWFPGDHPPMPDVIKRGPAGMGEVTRGCASCHLPNGKGRPENAPVAGLPMAYLLRQMQDFRHGLRASADPRKPNVPLMIALASALTDEELLASVQYFAALKYDTPWVRVVESPLVPQTKIVNQLFVPVAKALTEPINGRIIEVPEDEAQSELVRNPHSGFLAYVPPGSIEKGKTLALTGGLRIEGTTVVPGPTMACITCHGPELRGTADVPPIAGRSPSYLARQLWDMQQGTRHGSGMDLMKPVVAKLTPDDILNLAAYVASRPPR